MNQFISDSVTIIAEIGINHNGDIDMAKKLIDVAKVAGVDIVKFQKRNPDKCVPDAQKKERRMTPWGEMSYLEYKHRIEFGKEDYDVIHAYCQERGIEWTASIWDRDSLDFIMGYQPKSLKIPSALLTDLDLLHHVAETNILTYISTGMSVLAEIDQAVAVFKAKKCPYMMMHCNSSYPAQNSELNISCINTLREKYQCPIGYSGHEFGLIPSVLAVMCGAEAIERHITLKRTMWGTDHMASIEPVGLMKLVGYIRSIPESIGDGVKRIYPSEECIKQKLRRI